ELEHFIERAIILSKGAVLRAPLTELQPLEEGGADELNLEMANRRLILRSLLESIGVIGGPHGAPHDWHQENYTELQVKETKDSRERLPVVTRDERSSQLHDTAY
ncbi:MAG TPA: hypothetical protein VN843_17750, partial [Anaerolineales bacterium]|nr:hypothetical protein [Anaerolineales bacterium]